MNAFITYFRQEYIYILSKWGEHLLITLAALGIATTLSLVLAIVATRPGRERLQSIIVAVAGAMQSVPSIAVIAMAFPPHGNRHGTSYHSIGYLLHGSSSLQHRISHQIY